MSDAEYESKPPGTADPSKKFREMEVPEEEKKKIEKERQERLAPENRPDDAEVDNTKRTFDPGQGGFVDDD